MQTVAVIGASEKTQRASNRACEMLMERGYRVYAISPVGVSVHGAMGCKGILEVEEEVDTVTLYVGPGRQGPIMGEILEKKPRRVIFNPGTECEASERKLEEAGIEVVRDCTLIMLGNGEFEDEG